jgi:type 1 glutamine amidotransferase
VILVRCVCALAVAGLMGCASAMRASGPTCPPPPARKGTRVLVFHPRGGSTYHPSIPAGMAAIEALGGKYRFAVEETDDPATFEYRTLRKYSAVVFLNTLDDVLNEEEQAAFERYIHHGGGFVGIHGAAHTEFDWAWYGRLVGAYFSRLTGPWTATVVRVDSTHPSTVCMPATWRVTDEWYDYRAAPGPGVTILATVDEKSYRYGGMGAFHPIAWAHEFEGGRAWYTGLGHTKEVYSDPVFLDQLAGGILWASGR